MPSAATTTDDHDDDGGAGGGDTMMPPPLHPPGSPPRRASTITRTPSKSEASSSRNSPFTPRARKTALDRLPVHMLSFEDQSDDEEDDEAGEQRRRRRRRGRSSSSDGDDDGVTTTEQPQQPQQEQASSPTGATAAALRPWGEDTPSAKSGGGSGFNLSAEDLEFHSRIAAGAYGVVWRARLRPGWRRRRPGPGRRRRQSSVEAGAATEGEGEGGGDGDEGAEELEEGKPRELAVKVQRVPPGEEDEQGQANLLIELSVLQGLVHPRLVRYHGAALMAEADARGDPAWRPLLASVPGGQQQQQQQQQGLGGEVAAVIPEEPLLGAEEAKAEAGDGEGNCDDGAAAAVRVVAAAPTAAEPMLVLIVMEFCVRGSLRHALRQTGGGGGTGGGTGGSGGGGGLPWPLRVRIAADIAEGLAFLHAHGLLHRDLKTSNVLLDRAWRAKLCDHSFAAAAHSPDLDAFTCGTDEFLAPEAALGEPPGYDKPCDVFSLGVVLCELATGREPGKGGFLCRTARDLFQLCPEEVEAAAPADCPASLRMLALHCAQGEPGDRPTAAEAQEWAASLLVELTGGERAAAATEEEEGEEEGSLELELPRYASPLPWPPAQQPQQEQEEGVQEEEEGGRKGRQVSWAHVVVRGIAEAAAPEPEPQSQPQPRGHKRALSSSVSSASGSKPVPPVQEAAAALPGLLGDRGGRGQGGKRGGSEWNPDKGAGGKSRKRGQRGKRRGKERAGGSTGAGGDVDASSSTNGSSNLSPKQLPQEQQEQEQQRMRGRVGSLDNPLSLSLSSSLAASGFAGARLGTPNSNSKWQLPTTFAAAVIGGSSKAKEEAAAAAAAAAPPGELSALVEGIGGLGLESGGSDSKAQAPGHAVSPFRHDEEASCMGRLLAIGWETRMAQAWTRFQAQLGALQRELEEMGQQQERREGVLEEVAALERVLEEEVQGAVAGVKEAVAAFQERLLLLK